MTKLRILVVEDENIVALDLEQALRRVGYKVVGIARSAEEAVRKAADLRPDLILMDIQLRDRSDGIEAALQIRANSDVPVIFLTAYADEKTLERAKTANPLGYLVKPFNEQDLYTAIEVGLDKHHRETAERKATEQALFQSEERFHLLIDAIGEYALYLMDPDGKVATWNNGAERIYGYGAADVMGLNFSRFFREEERRSGEPAAILEEAKTRGHCHREGWRIRGDGRQFWAETDVTALYDPNGRLRGFAMVAHDVTERKHIEDRQRELLDQEQAAREEAERLNKLKDQFLQILSHELRTPLTPILGWTVYLRSVRYNQETVERAVDIIERNTRTQIALIEDLLDVSRIASGNLSLNLQPVVLAPILESAFAAIRPLADAKGVQIRLVKDETTAIVLGDPLRLEQIFYSLLSNAVKFTPKTGSVELQLLAENSCAIVRVKDTGEGIVADFLPHAFQRFSQADSSTTRRFGGLGIGLSIVEYLVEQHGGKISVESGGRNQGSTFTVKLPLACGSGRAAGPSFRNIAASDGHRDLMGVRILVVDDQQDALDLLATLLEGAGAIPILACSTEDAMAKFRQNPPDLVLTDIGMPREDGYDLLRKIRKLNRQIPVIAVTAYAQHDDRRRAMKEGFHEHIVKPLDPDKLISVIASVLKDK